MHVSRSGCCCGHDEIPYSASRERVTRGYTLRFGVDNSDGIGEAGVVAQGVVRVGDDAESDLRVKVLLVEGTLALVTNVVEVGSWPVETVEIVRVGADRFDFTVEGDTVSFFPDEPVRFSQLGIVSQVAPKRSRRRRSPGLNGQASIRGSESTPKRRKRRKKIQLADKPSEAGTSKAMAKSAHHFFARDERLRTRRQARLAAKLQKSEGDRRVKRRGSPPVSRRVARLTGVMRKHSAAKAKTSLRWTRWKARLGWLWTLDRLRQTDIYLLDRIPVVTDEMRLEPGHKHDYEVHTAAAGITRYVCTSCGKLRLTPPREFDDEEEPSGP